MVKPAEPTPPPMPDRGPRRLTNIADYASLARVYAAAYQGHASSGSIDAYSRLAATLAVHDFCKVIQEEYDGT